MACFNSKEARIAYFKQYCERCANWKDRMDGLGTGCLIDDLHAEYSGGDEWDILDRMIPESHDGPSVTYMQCALFHEKSSESLRK